jgi:hypothetical protein
VTTKLFIIVLTAVLFGALTGYLGSAVDHYNHSQVGVIYKQWRGEWLAFPSLPGALLAEQQAGHDWRADEQWLHRHSVASWNALFWSGAVLLCSLPFVLRSLPRSHVSNHRREKVGL